MSIYNEPEFQALVKRVRLYKWWSLARCLYCWVPLLAPLLLLDRVIDRLSVAATWAYLAGMLLLFVWGVSLWVRGINGVVAPLHKPLTRFIKQPTEAGLRRICAGLVSVRQEKRHPRGDYDLMRRAHTIASRNTAIIPRELFDFYTTILRACKVAGI